MGTFVVSVFSPAPAGSGDFPALLRPRFPPDSVPFSTTSTGFCDGSDGVALGFGLVFDIALAHDDESLVSCIANSVKLLRLA